MALSRIGGITFNGIHITNMDFNLNTYKLISVDIPLTPAMTYREFKAPRRNGSKPYDNRYEDKETTVTIGVTGTAIERQQKITSLVEQWVGVEDKLIFDNRPNVFYKAKFYNAIAQKDTGTFTEFAIVFKASYCMYGLLEKDIAWTGITTGTTKQITNEGNYRSESIIKVSGTATLLNLTIGQNTFSLNNVSDAIYIDNDNMIVYKIIDNKKVSYMQEFNGDFLALEKGTNDVIISGTSLNLNINFNFRDTYIV